MRRQIITTIVAFTALAVAAFGIPLAVVIRQLYVNEARVQLEREATVAADELVAAARDGSGSVPIPTARAGVTFTVYDAQGRRVNGSGPVEDERAAVAAQRKRVLDDEQDEHLVARLPIVVAGTVVSVLRADTSVHAAEHRAHLAWVLMAAFGGGIVLVAATLAIIRANRLVRPLRRVRDGAIRLGHGDFSVSLPHSGVRELDELAGALTSTATRLGVTLAREQSFSAHASHQLRTPLTGLRVTLEGELAAPRADPATALHECLAITDRLEETITDLLRLARRPRSNERFDVGRALEAVRLHWTKPCAAAGRRLVVDDVPSPVPAVMASAAAIGQALDVLVDNALQHGTGAVSVTAEVTGQSLALRVTDDGPRPVPGPGERRGAGIGLDLARTLVEAEGGRIERVASGPPTTYQILLPLIRAGGTA